MRIAAASALLAGCALLFGGCASRPLPADVPGLAPAKIAREVGADRQVVVTVRNGPVAGPALAGSTGRGYGALGRYRASPAALRDADGIGRLHRLRTLAAWPIEALDVHCIVFGIDDDRPLAGVIDELRADARVESAQPMGLFRAQGAGAGADPYVGLQPAIADMQVLEAHRWSRGAGVRVAVIDSGIDASHPDLADRIVFSRDVTGRATGSPARDVHGTAVAGVIAADAGNGIGIVGVAPEAKLLALRACWPASGSADAPTVCDTLSLAQALALAISERVDVINLSLSGPADPLLERLLRRAMDAGRIVVAAVPEDAATPPGFPAGVRGVLAVASAGAPARSDIAGLLQAPGRDVLTLRPGGRYDFDSGSSIAAAHVSGIVALARAVRRELTAAQVRELVAQDALVATDTLGAPIVNACRVVARLVAADSCTPVRRMHATRQ